MKYFLAIAFTLVALTNFAQGKKVDEVTIKSSIQCEMCVEKLDTMFADYWAVKSVDYDLDNQTITVKYNTKRTDAEQIREAISSVGYDADDVPAKIDSYLELNRCCRKGMHKKEVE